MTSIKKANDKDLNLVSDKPLVSAIIIFLNEERFLQEAVQSVFAQTYDNWELLLVDDGSIDKSTEVARRYAKQHPEKVRYLEHNGHKNRGMSASRNLGIGNARGKYISWLDGDDVWLANKLDRQVTILESQPEAVMVYGPVQRWHSWTENPEDRQRDDLYGLHAWGVNINVDTLIKPPNLLILFLRHEQLIPAGIMILREAIERVEGAEEVFHADYEDAALLTKVCLFSTVFVSGECWYRYRQHPASCNNLTRIAGQSDSTQLIFLDWIGKYLSQQRVLNKEIWRALRQGRRHILLSSRYPVLFRLLENYRQFKWKSSQGLKRMMNIL